MTSACVNNSFLFLSFLCFAFVLVCVLKKIIANSLDRCPPPLKNLFYHFASFVSICRSFYLVHYSPYIFISNKKTSLQISPFWMTSLRTFLTYNNSNNFRRQTPTSQPNFSSSYVISQRYPLLKLCTYPLFFSTFQLPTLFSVIILITLLSPYVSN